MSTTEDLELEAAIREAQDTFDLGELLDDRSFNTETVTVFTDEKTGKELGGEYPVYGQFGHVAGFERKGVIGKILDLLDLKKAEQEYDAEELERLMQEAEELTAKLEKTALKIELRSVPEDIKKVARAKAKKALGIKGRVPADEEDEYNRKEFAFIVARSILSITKPDGTRRTRFSVVDAEALRDKLPIGEFGKVHEKVTELSYKAAVATKHTIGDLDFSPAGS